MFPGVTHLTEKMRCEGYIAPVEEGYLYLQERNIKNVGQA
jgi:hypothetical protein